MAMLNNQMVIPQTLGWFQVSHKTFPQPELRLQARQLCVDQARAQLEEAETKQKAPGNSWERLKIRGKIMGKPGDFLGKTWEILVKSWRTPGKWWNNCGEQTKPGLGRNRQGKNGEFIFYFTNLAANIGICEWWGAKCGTLDPSSWSSLGWTMAQRASPF